MSEREKIRAEVERLKSNLIHGACASQVAMETRCKEESYNEVLAILDSLQVEPASKVWHDASEEPEEGKDFAFVTYDGIMWARYRIEDIFIGWQRYRIQTELDRWAYVSDLLKL